MKIKYVMINEIFQKCICVEVFCKSFQAQYLLHSEIVSVQIYTNVQKHIDVHPQKRIIFLGFIGSIL